MVSLAEMQSQMLLGVGGVNSRECYKVSVM